MTLKTMTGITQDDLSSLLDQELPAEAYSEVPGASYLTDIDPNWMRKIFNQVFGLCGLGWGYDYRSEDITVEQTGETGQRSREATLKRIEFWYILVAEDGKQLRCFVPASGGSENRNAVYALKGAITAAIGNAASNIGWQEAVYLGHRSHKTVGKKATTSSAALKATSKPSPASKSPAAADKPLSSVSESPLSAPRAPAPTTVSGNGNNHKPAAAPVVAAVLESMDDPLEPQQGQDWGAYVVPTGSNKGKLLSAVSEAWLLWAANDMQPTSNEGKLLKEAAQKYLAQKK